MLEIMSEMDISPRNGSSSNIWTNNIPKNQIYFETISLKPGGDQAIDCNMVKMRKTIDMETMMMNLNEFGEYSEVANIIKQPDDQQLEPSIINQSDININNCQSYSELLKSPDRKEISYRKMADYSRPTTESNDDPAPTTSTPERRAQRSIDKKYKMYRPPDLVIEDVINKNDCNTILDVVQCSPVKSPFPSPDFFDNSLLDLDDTLLPPVYSSPPLKIIDTSMREERKLMSLFQNFGLNHLAFIFIEQEVDVELFLTLNDTDLEEIGIQKKTDRDIILSVITECNRRYHLS